MAVACLLGVHMRDERGHVALPCFRRRADLGGDGARQDGGVARGLDDFRRGGSRERGAFRGGSAVGGEPCGLTQGFSTCSLHMRYITSALAVTNAFRLFWGSALKTRCRNQYSSHVVTNAFRLFWGSAPKFSTSFRTAIHNGHQCLSAVLGFSTIHRTRRPVLRVRRSPMPFGCFGVQHFKIYRQGYAHARGHQCLSAVLGFSTRAWHDYRGSAQAGSPMPFGCFGVQHLRSFRKLDNAVALSPMPFGCFGVQHTA